MGAIKVIHRGSFNKFEEFANRVLRRDYLNCLSRYGAEGVALLSAATPKDTGLTAASWGFEILKKSHECGLRFTNTNLQGGINIAIILNYGHATGNGAWISGRKYIEPEILPLFDKMAEECWKEVVK